ALGGLGGTLPVAGARWASRCKDAGSARIGQIRARLRTPQLVRTARSGDLSHVSSSPPNRLERSGDDRPAASASSSRPDGRGVRTYPRAARARSEPLRAGGLLAALERALRLQALGALAEAAAVHGRASPSRPGRERR